MPITITRMVFALVSADVLTVHLYFWQSGKYPEAENFLRITTVDPKRSACPMLITPPAV